MENSQDRTQVDWKLPQPQLDKLDKLDELDKLEELEELDKLDKLDISIYSMSRPNLPFMASKSDLNLLR